MIELLCQQPTIRVFKLLNDWWIWLSSADWNIIAAFSTQFLGQIYGGGAHLLQLVGLFFQMWYTDGIKTFFYFPSYRYNCQRKGIQKDTHMFPLSLAILFSLESGSRVTWWKDHGDFSHRGVRSTGGKGRRGVGSWWIGSLGFHKIWPPLMFRFPDQRLEG